MELKIKIKETVEERRILTDDEFWIFNSKGGVDYLEKNKGFKSIISSGEGQFTGVFRKETIRDATPYEKWAWLTREIFPNAIPVFLKCEFENKEFIPELI